MRFSGADGQVQKFARNAATALGQSQQGALDAAATFGVFGKSAGLAGRDNAKFSTELTTLAADMASFSNTTPEQAVEALGSALRGESEPIRQYGVLLDDATLKARAMKLGRTRSSLATAPSKDEPPFEGAGSSLSGVAADGILMARLVGIGVRAGVGVIV